MSVMTLDMWTECLHSLGASETDVTHTTQLKIRVATQLWQAKVATTVRNPPRTSADAHVDAVLQDIRRGITNDSLIGVTTTQFGASYWGVQKTKTREV